MTTTPQQGQVYRLTSVPAYFQDWWRPGDLILCEYSYTTNGWAHYAEGWEVEPVLPEEEAAFRLGQPGESPI